MFADPFFEQLAALFVVAEQIERGAGGRQQHGVAGRAARRAASIASSSDAVEITSGTTPVKDSTSLRLSTPMQTSVCTFSRAKALSGS